MTGSAVDVASKILGFWATVGKHVGLLGMVLAFLTLACLSSLVSFADRTLKLIGRIQKQWRKLPRGVQLFTLTFGGLVALIGVLPTLVAVIPWRATAMAAGLGFVVPYYSGAFYLARRYPDADSPWRIWHAHLRARAGRVQLERGSEKATGKKGATASRVQPRTDDTSAVMTPPFGMSAAEYAQEVNDGKHNSALASEMGRATVQSVSAFPQSDGTVLVTVAHVADSPAPDPLVKEEWWTPPASV